VADASFAKAASNAKGAAEKATITRNAIVPKLPGAPGWQQETEPTPLQEKIFALLHDHPMSCSQ
jgi:hypothetical protein